MVAMGESNDDAYDILTGHVPEQAVCEHYNRNVYLPFGPSTTNVHMVLTGNQDNIVTF